LRIVRVIASLSGSPPLGASVKHGYVPVTHKLMLFGNCSIGPRSHGFIAMGLFLKVGDVVATEHKPPKPRRTKYIIHRSQFCWIPVKLDDALNVDI
jgi:hypothetical protein